MSIIKRKAGSEDIVKSVLEFDEVPTEGSPNLVESGAVAQAIGNLGKPLQWKGPATVAQLNAGITGIQEGWTYTLTDAGTLTDGSVDVEPGDEVAWTEDDEWFKVGGDDIVFATYGSTAISTISTAISNGKSVIVKKTSGGQTLYGALTDFNSGIYSFSCLNGGIVYTMAITPDAGDGTWSIASDRIHLNNGGVLTDAASVDVPNNALSTLATAQATLTLNVNAGSGEVPNFAVEVTPSVNCTLTVTKTVGDTVTTLNPSVAGGDELTGTRKYQVTCVGSCWTLAEFEVPA